MRVAYVCTDPGVPVFGDKGCSIHVQAILRAMLRRGFQVDLFAARLGGAPPVGLSELCITRLKGIDRELAAGRREEQLLARNRELRIQLEKQPDYDLVYERYALWSHAAMQFAADAGVASILEVNAPLLTEQARHRGLVNIAAAHAATAKAFSAAWSVVAVSRAVARHVAEFTAAEKILVVPNGVDPEAFLDARHQVQQRAAARARVASPGCTIGFTGTLRPWHGMEVLGQAFQRFHRDRPAARLLVIGDGPARSTLLEHLGPAVAATRITGKIPHAQVPTYLSQVDIGVVPYPNSGDFYFSPLKLFEYMACGLPVVASRIGDIPTYVQDRVTARLVPVGDASAFASAFAEIADQRSLGCLLGRHAARAVDDHHTWDQVLGRMLAFAVDGSLPLLTARRAV